MHSGRSGTFLQGCWFTNKEVIRTLLLAGDCVSTPGAIPPPAARHAYARSIPEKAIIPVRPRWGLQEWMGGLDIDLPIKKLIERKFQYRGL
jgi:hypothetical protein